ncbi:MAG: hypothetical protein ACRYGM_05315 [Janthinobacterium lividum]
MLNGAEAARKKGKAIVDSILGPAAVTKGFTIEETQDRPHLQVVGSDLPATARELRDVFADRSQLYDRGGVVVKLARSADGGAPMAVEVTANGIVREAHRLVRPVSLNADKTFKPVTLSERVAGMYLDMRGEWNLPALDGITTAPVLADDGAILDRDGYDPGTRLWCAKMPKLDVPANPTRADAEAALLTLRAVIRTFPFGDAPRTVGTKEVPPMVDICQPAKLDESAALAALLTAVCRPSLYLAPGYVVTAPPISGAGAGKGMLVRAICLIAFGVPPRAFTAGTERNEMDKRLVAELIEAAPAMFLDNLNGAALRSDILASVLTERPARVRIMGKSLMVPLNSTAFIALTGNGLSMSEDLARRFLATNLDAQMEDPEARPFAPGFLNRVKAARPELLAAALTIWRWGRQNAATLTRGRQLGSFEQWAEWVRDPLLTLGCADPVDRIVEAKAADPARKQVSDLYEAWYEQHDSMLRAVKDLGDEVRAIADPLGRGRQHLATYLDKLTGTRAAGFVLQQSKPSGKWGQTLYKLEVTDREAVRARQEAAKASRPAGAF